MHSAFSRSALQFSRIFPDFSIHMIILKAFQGLKNFYIKFQDFPYFSRICRNSVFIYATYHTLLEWCTKIPTDFKALLHVTAVIYVITAIYQSTFIWIWQDMIKHKCKISASILHVQMCQHGSYAIQLISHIMIQKNQLHSCVFIICHCISKQVM